MMRYMSRDEGSALLAVLFVLVMIAGLALAMSNTFQVRGRAASASVWASRATYAGEGAIEFAFSEIWNPFLAANGGVPGPVPEFKTFLETGGGFVLLDGASLDLATQAPDFGVDLDSLSIQRVDVAGGIEVDLIAKANFVLDGENLTFTRTFRVGGGAFPGLTFALFSNNVNCIFCHAEIDSVAKFSSENYPRVKVATLESMLVRVGSADSRIAGDLYVRGSMTDKSGVPLGSLIGSTLDAYEYGADGMVTTDEFGAKVGKEFTLNDNFWRDGVSADYADGGVPDEFPAPFPDTDQDMVIDDSEYDSIAAASGGTLSGGVVYEVGMGGSYGPSALPVGGTAASLSGSSGGNVILVGTDANPIVIDGQVAIGGDLVISGKIKGSGSLWARGNVYVVGDLTYADGVDAVGDRTYGTAADGTQNSLGLTAGGNIMIGDYLTPKKGDIMDVTDRTSGDSSGSFGFVMSEVTLFNRREWTKTQPTLPVADGSMVANTTYDPSYVPNYYVQNDTGEIGVFVNSRAYWDPASESWAGKEHGGRWTDLIIVDPATMPAGTVVSSLAPGANWLTESQLKDFWIDDEQARPAGTPFQVDSMLYTNRSIFALTRRRGASTGKMVINGAVVAKDTGLLSGGGLELNYDERVSEHLGIMDFGTAAFVRTGTMTRRH